MSLKRAGKASVCDDAAAAVDTEVNHDHEALVHELRCNSKRTLPVSTMREVFVTYDDAIIYESSCVSSASQFPSAFKEVPHDQTPASTPSCPL